MLTYHSVFVCDACENPLYVSSDGVEICLTQVCTKYDARDGSPVDNVDADTALLARDLAQTKLELEKQINGWEQDVLALRLFHVRSSLAGRFLDVGAVTLDELHRFHAINTVLVINRKEVRFKGLERGESEFQKLLEAGEKYNGKGVTKNTPFNDRHARLAIIR